MRAVHYSILVLSLAVLIDGPRTIAAAAASTNTTTAAASILPECSVNSLPTTIEQLQNPGQDPIAFLFAEGVRVYNCSTGTPQLNSGGLVNITNGGLTNSTAPTKTNWTGIGYYPDSEGNGTFALTEINSKTGASVGKEFFLTLDYSTVEFIPAPDGVSLPWARWNVFTVPRSLQNELGIGWGSRVNTVGGAEPKDCSNTFVNNSVVVNYTAFYYFYPCPSSSGSSSISNSSLAPSQEQGEKQQPSAVSGSGRTAVTGVLSAVVWVVFCLFVSGAL